METTTLKSFSQKTTGGSHIDQFDDNARVNGLYASHTNVSELGNNVNIDSWLKSLGQIVKRQVCQNGDEWHTPDFARSIMFKDSHMNSRLEDVSMCDD